MPEQPKEPVTLIDMLRREHDLIEHAVDVLRAVADRPAETEVPEDAAHEIVAFFREFADIAHCAQEEEVLFPALEAQGVPTRGGPMGSMFEDHESCRDLTGQMAHALELGVNGREGRDLFREAARDYAILVGQHMFRETHVLFEMADRVLPPEENVRLGKERAPMHREAMARYEEALRDLARRMLAPQDAA